MLVCYIYIYTYTYVCSIRRCTLTRPPAIFSNLRNTLVHTPTPSSNNRGHTARPHPNNYTYKKGIGCIKCKHLQHTRITELSHSNLDEITILIGFLGVGSLCVAPN